MGPRPATEWEDEGTMRRSVGLVLCVVLLGVGALLLSGIDASVCRVIPGEWARPTGRRKGG